jgi:predicted permease
MGLPMGRYGSNGAYEIEGSPEPAFVAQKPQAGFRLASPEYFATMGIPLLRGRDFSARDTYDAPFVAIVSQVLVRRSFAGQNPIGKRIRCGLDGPEWMTIVGVVADVRQQSPAAAQDAELYMPLAQHPFRANEVQIAVRSAIPSESLLRTVEQRMRQMQPDMAIKSTTMETMLADAVSAPRFRTSLVSGFAMIALLLAMAGVYGVMAYITAQRTSEFGLRLALGSSPRGLLRLILSRALALTAAGIVLGFVLSIALGRAAKALLFGVTPTDASTYAVVLVGVTLATLAAAAVPALRAMRIDPIAALREE